MCTCLASVTTTPSFNSGLTARTTWVLLTNTQLIGSTFHTQSLRTASKWRRFATSIRKLTKHKITSFVIDFLYSGKTCIMRPYTWLVAKFSRVLCLFRTMSDVPIQDQLSYNLFSEHFKGLFTGVMSRSTAYFISWRHRVTGEAYINSRTWTYDNSLKNLRWKNNEQCKLPCFFSKSSVVAFSRTSHLSLR